ncbi:aspartate aminotransferase family protein [bacterium]|jgi:sphinganine-1-phosphate aldolase|nr:aspartate aminotransferase family protein [bacterium]
MENNVTLPKKGTDREQVLKQLNEARAKDTRWQEGRLFSLVYHESDEHTEFLKKAFTSYFHENGLNPGAFPSLKKFEGEVISMAAHLLGGGERAAGTMTSGGSESIMMSMKAHRDWGRQTKGITEPEVIYAMTAHPAFDKAAHYFGVKPVKVPVDSGQRMDVNAAKAALTKNTILIVGSAPQYPHGVMDPIAELAAVARDAGVGMHVDACVGGFMLPFLRRLGKEIPPFDFSIEGVTAISADLHKYGFAAKGASVILYRDKDLRRFQFFITKDWPGGLFVSPSVTGTRPAGSIAAAWAAFQALGEEGYVEVYRRLSETTARYRAGIEALDYEIVGNPVGTLFAYQSQSVNIHVIADLMEAKGWFIDRQMSPDSIHLTITPANTASCDRYLADLKESTEYARAHPELAQEGMAAMYGMVAKIPDPTMVNQFLYQYLDRRYET